MIRTLSVLSGGLLGWSLGANDAANVFGTAVTTRVIKYKTAVVLTAVFVIIGALINGGEGIDNLSEYAFSSSVTSPQAAFLTMLAAAITVTMMTFFTLPVSTSQCVIGSIVGWGLSHGVVDFTKTTEFVSAWIITPLGSCIICLILSFIAQKFIQKKISGIVAYDIIIKIGFVLSGIFSAYSLGANNVANVTAVYSGGVGIITKEMACLVGGVSIALGVLTFSKRVMYTVGTKITDLSPLLGFIVTLSAAIAVYIYAIVGIPVSSSQAIVGAVIGAGLTNGVKNINFKILRNIFVAWFGTPTVAGILSFTFGYFLG